MPVISDIHAHSTLMNGFMYGNVYDDNDRFERQAVFPKLLCNNAEDFSLVSLSRGLHVTCFKSSLRTTIFERYNLSLSSETTFHPAFDVKSML